jgi:hypothetical protein
VSFLEPPGKVKPLLQVEIHSFSLQTTREFIGVGGLSRQGLLLANWHSEPSKLSGQLHTPGAMQNPRFWHGGIQIAVENQRKWFLFEIIDNKILFFPVFDSTHVRNRAFCPSWPLSRYQVFRIEFAFVLICPGRRSPLSIWRHSGHFWGI